MLQSVNYIKPNTCTYLQQYKQLQPLKNLTKDMVFGSSLWSCETVVTTAHEVEERRTSIWQVNRIWDILNESLF